MSPKLGQTKTDSVNEDRNYVGIEINLGDGDVTECAQFADESDALAWVAREIAENGSGPHCTFGFMDAVEFDALED